MIATYVCNLLVVKAAQSVVGYKGQDHHDKMIQAASTCLCIKATLFRPIFGHQSGQFLAHIK